MSGDEWKRNENLAILGLELANLREFGDFFSEVDLKPPLVVVEAALRIGLLLVRSYVLIS